MVPLTQVGDTGSPSRRITALLEILTLNAYQKCSFKLPYLVKNCDVQQMDDIQKRFLTRTTVIVEIVIIKYLFL